MLESLKHLLFNLGEARSILAWTGFGLKSNTSAVEDGVSLASSDRSESLRVALAIES